MIYQPFPIGRVCHKCGVWKPRSEMCKEKRCTDGISHCCSRCSDAIKRKRNKEHPEIMKAAHQRYRARHLEQERQRDKDQAEAHKKAAKIRRSKNPEPYRKYQRSWQKANREKTRKYERTYREKHPEKFREKDQRRQSLNLGLPATFTGQDWIRALDYFGYRCAICGRPEGFWHILAQDHWIAQSNGGGYSPENIIPLCHAKKDGSDCCNNDKGSRDPVEWLMTTYNARKAKTIIQRITNYFEWINQHN